MEKSKEMLLSEMLDAQSAAYGIFNLYQISINYLNSCKGML